MTATTTTLPAARPGTWARFGRNQLAVAGGLILAAVALLALAAPLLPLPDPNATDLPNRLAPVFSAGHLLGADHLGRDMLSRIVWEPASALPSA